MLERLKQSSVLDLITIKVNTDIFEKENRMCHRKVFIDIMFKTTTKVLMIGMSLYLRSVKLTSNLKKGKIFGNKKLKTFCPHGLNEKEEYLF